MGVAGEKGAESVVRCVGGRCLGKRSSGVGRDMAALGDFGGKTMRREHSFPSRFRKNVPILIFSHELLGICFWA